MQTWSSWKRFAEAQSGRPIEAPVGPGVYEVRHAETGELVAFGHAGNVANAITQLRANGPGRSWLGLLRQNGGLDTFALEYRTCATATRAEARTAAARLDGLRQSYWRKRMALGWAGRHSRP